MLLISNDDNTLCHVFNIIIYTELNLTAYCTYVHFLSHLLEMITFYGGNKVKCFCSVFSELQFEECPKWLAVRDVLSEIEAEIENNPRISANNNSSTCCVLIVAQDDRTCSQIRDVRFGGVKYLISFLLVT